MSTIYDDEDYDWVDGECDYVELMRSKKKMNKTDGIGGRSWKFTNRNFSGEYAASGEDFEAGISKESWAVTKEDGEVNKEDLYLERGKDGVSSWYRHGIDFAESIEIEDEYDDEEF